MSPHDLRCAAAVLLFVGVLPLIAVYRPAVSPGPLLTRDRLLVAIAVTVFVIAL